MRLAALIVLVLALLCAQPAAAATVSVAGATLHVSAAPGEQNRLTARTSNCGWVGERVRRRRR